MLNSLTPLANRLPLNPENDSALKFKLLIETMNMSPVKQRNHILIRVVHGGDKSPQLDKFQAAYQSFLLEFKEEMKITIEYLGPKEVGKKRWMPNQLIDWLLESNIHFILTHINQGRSSHGLMWCMRDMIDQLSRLYYHLGFPSGQHLICDVFIQNKGAYINKLNIEKLSIPTSAPCKQILRSI